MDIKAYIASGILELYALSQLEAEEAKEVEKLLVLYPELTEELAQIYDGLSHYAQQNAIEPRPEVEKLLFAKIDNLRKEKIMDPGDLPLISALSVLENWKKFAERQELSAVGDDGKSIKVLTKTEKTLQLLITSSSDFELETHDEELESFLILSGQVLCTIGNTTIMMSGGDFMEIPLHEPHEVKILSPQVTAIVQRITV